jgi:uncharacterized protein YjbJ (UPF0337 family)
MSLLDKLLGRSKKAAGDLIDSPGLRREGAHQEAEGKAEERAEVHETEAAEARTEAAEHRQERETP